jgi:hypothetical protein
MQTKESLKEQAFIVNEIITYIDYNRSKHYDGDFDGSIMGVLIAMQEDINLKISAYTLEKNKHE